MTPSCEPLKCKKAFLQENELLSELELSDALRPIGKLSEFDLVENEIWLLQCPKGMNLTELQGEKLKIPGRTNINSLETVSMEFTEGNIQHAFAYYDRGKHYDLRLLPVRGTVVVRDRLKAIETITSERAQECCSPNKRLPMPSSIRVRHPLLGAQYEDKVKLDKSIVKRLQEADKISARVLKERVSLKRKSKFGAGFDKPTNSKEDTSFPIEINSAGDDIVEFVSEEKLKKKKKRKHSLSNDAEQDSSLALSKKKSKKSKASKELLSKDLEWLQNI